MFNRSYQQNSNYAPKSNQQVHEEPDWRQRGEDVVDPPVYFYGYQQVCVLGKLQQKQSVWMQEPEPLANTFPKCHEPEEPALENASSCDLSENISASPTYSPSLASTQLIEWVNEQQPPKHCYRLHSRILQGSCITECMRAKIHGFLMAETAKQCLLRETYGLACVLADLFFAHGGQVEINDYQTMVLGCLILATKIKEGKFPTISFQAFNREQLMNYQIEVALRLKFNLTPPTHQQHSQLIAALWEIHAKKCPALKPKMGDIVEGVSVAIRTFQEQLDCAFMVLSTLDLELQAVVANLFYINVRAIHLGPQSPAELSLGEFKSIFYTSQDPFRIDYQTFLKSYSKKTDLLNMGIGTYLKPFLTVQAQKGQSSIQGSEKVLQSMRKWDQFQTTPKGNYALAKSVISSNKMMGNGGRAQKTINSNQS